MAQTEAPASSPIESSADLRNVFQLVSCGETGSGSIPIAVLGKQSNAGMTPPSKLHDWRPLLFQRSARSMASKSLSFWRSQMRRLNAPSGVWYVAQDCGENCVGLRWKQAVMGAYKRKGNGLRSAINVSKCSHNVAGALLGCRIHNPKIGGSIPPSLPIVLSVRKLHQLLIRRMIFPCRLS